MTNKVARIWRRADVPEEVAVAGINLRYPPDEGWTIKSFAKEAREDASGTFDAFVAELEKTAAPFPPDDDAADKADVDLPEPEVNEPEPKEDKGDSKESEILTLLHKVVNALGLDGEKPKDDAPADPGADPAAEARPADQLPPPTEPHHGIGKGLGPQNMPAFGKVFETDDLRRVARSRYATAQMPDNGEKLGALVAEANEILSVVNKKVAAVQRGVVKGEKLIRIQIGPNA
jgi:hypothetical protein